MRVFRALGFVSVVAALAVPSAKADGIPQRMSIVDLGALAGGGSIPLSINNSGVAVGFSLDGDGIGRAVVFDPPELPVSLEPADAGFGEALDISDDGVVVGVIGAASDQPRAVSWTFDQGAQEWRVRELPSLSPGSRSEATAVNDSGVIVGVEIEEVGVTSYVNHAVRWTNGELFDLGPSVGASDSFARDVNNRGDVAGTGFFDDGVFGFITDGFTSRRLPTLGGSYSFGQAINDKGAVVGSAALPVVDGFEGQHAFVYRGGFMRDLGTLGGEHSNAVDINESGLIVGAANLPGPHKEQPSHAFIANAGRMVDLNSYLPAGTDWELSFADAVNDDGEIVGLGYRNGEQHAFLMTPQNN